MNKPKRRILLVDDDGDLLRLLTLRLSAAGYEVMPVKSGIEALAQLIIFQPQLVLTDLRMDGMDGLTLFDAIRQENPSLPVIILTAHGTIPDAVSATRKGAFSFLTKPFDGQDLLDHIAQALRAGAHAATRCVGADGDEEDLSWRQGIIGRSPAMEQLLQQVRLIAKTESSVLIRGESGSGKELIAKAIHQAGKRHAHRFVALNCGAISESLLEAELFGSAPSHNGAGRDGLLRAAEGGTLFLDEVGDMPPALQIKLVRVLQENHGSGVDGNAGAVDVRIIAATQRDLDAAVAEGRFRDDLFYRLNVVSLDVPPLRERREDIPLLAAHFFGELGAQLNRSPATLAPEALETLVSAQWPGNVRQLRNVLEQAMVLSTGAMISAALIRRSLRDRPLEMLSLKDARDRFEQHYLIRLLQITRGNVSQAARLAKRNRTEFYKLLHRHQLDPTQFKQP